MQRLAEALQAAEKLAAEEKVVGVADALDNVAEAAVKAEGAMPTLAPGTQHVGQVMSAKVGFLCPVLPALHALLSPHALRLIASTHLLPYSPCMAPAAVRRLPI